MRKTTGLIVASAALVGLTACSSPAGSIDTPDGACTPIWPAGGIAGSIDASGAVVTNDDGSIDTSGFELDMPTPLNADAASTSVLTAGDGDVVAPDAVVGGTIVLYDGSTGELVTGGSAVFPLGTDVTTIFDLAACTTVGSRVVAAGTASELIGDGFVSSWGLDPEMTIVSVLDVEAAYLARATGDAVLPQNGLPTVSYAADGRPGLSFTNAEAPEDFRMETLIQGSGEEVADGDTVLVHYTGVDWDTHEVFDSSWDRGVPSEFPTTGVIKGFSMALVGQRVGTQVLVTIPPSLGYGDSSSSPVGADGVMVFVIDILGITQSAE